MQQRLAEKVVIVTGGTRGMGEAEVRGIVANGGKVVFGGRDEAAGRAIESDLGGHAVYVRQDVRYRADWERIVAITLQRFGRIDGLVNNAGVAFIRPLSDITDTQIEETIAVNQVGMILGIQHVVGPMRDVGKGSIINISSPCAIKGIPNSIVYSGAKAAAIGITLAASVELAAEHIRVNAVTPGFFDTRVLQDATSGRGREIAAEASPMKRIAETEEIVGPIVFLLSDESSYVTGAQLTVDGGYTA